MNLELHYDNILLGLHRINKNLIISGVFGYRQMISLFRIGNIFASKKDHQWGEMTRKERQRSEPQREIESES